MTSQAQTVGPDALAVDFSGSTVAELEASLEQAGALYEEHGAFLARGMFRPEDYAPIHRDLQRLIELKMKQVGMEHEPEDDGLSRFDDGFIQLNRASREHGGTIYQAARRVTAIHELAVHPKLTGVAKGLMNTETLISNGILAVRTDQPNEDKFLFEWHQDYPFIQDSEDGVVFWLGLHDVDESNGWLRIIPGSHKLGVLPVNVTDPHGMGGNRAHSMEIADLSVVDSMPRVNVPVRMGDVLVFNTLMLHASNPNRSARTRWTIQCRYGNFENERALAKNWPGVVNLGREFERTHPEYVANLAELDAPEFGTAAVRCG